MSDNARGSARGPARGPARPEVLEMVQIWNSLSSNDRMDFIWRAGLWVVCTFQHNAVSRSGDDGQARILVPVARHRILGKIVEDVGGIVGRMQTMHEFVQKGLLSLNEAGELKYLSFSSPQRLAGLIAPAIATLKDLARSIDVLVDEGLKNARKEGRKGDAPKAKAPKPETLETSQGQEEALPEALAPVVGKDVHQAEASGITAANSEEGQE